MDVPSTYKQSGSHAGDSEHSNKEPPRPLRLLLEELERAVPEQYKPSELYSSFCVLLQIS